MVQRTGQDAIAQQTTTPASRLVNRSPPGPPELPHPPRQSNPESDASCFATFTWNWIQPLIALGTQRPLMHSDLPPLREQDSIYAAVDVLPADQSASRTLLRAYGRPYLTALLIFQPLWLALGVAQVFVVQGLVRVVSDEDEHQIWEGIALAAAMFLTGFGRSMAEHFTFRYTVRYGMQARAALSAKIYAKALRLRQNSYPPEQDALSSEKRSGPVAEETNVLTNDTQRVLDAFTFIAFLLFTPVVVVVVSAILFIFLGWASLFGFLVLLLMISLQGLIGRWTAKIRARSIVETDARVALQSEIIRGIRIIKYGGWEAVFSDKIRNLRQREFKWLVLAGLLESINNSITFLAPVLVATATFTAYTLFFEEKLTPESAFLAISLFNIVSNPLILMPFAVKAVSESSIALGRIDRYLGRPEVSLRQPTSKKPGAFEIKQGSFAWSEDGEPVLRDISISVTPGAKVAIVGKVGSGKSSLVMALLGELQLLSGTVEVSGKTAFASQVPWITPQTIKENILTGTEFDEGRYSAVLNACCLQSDLALLPAGDQTEVGERGVNLSGGQKARLSLARACYAKSDIVVLDDPLSAVDAKVARQLTSNLFSRNSKLLAGRTVVLVTHNLDVIADFDTILGVNTKRIIFTGSKDSFKETGLWNDLAHAEPTSCETTSSSKVGPAKESSRVTKISAALQKVLGDDREVSQPLALPTNGALIEDEDREFGKLSRSVFWLYGRLAGGLPALGVCSLAFVSAQVLKQWSDFWVASWSGDFRSGDDARGDRFYAIAFAVLSLGIFVTSCIRTATYMTLSRVASNRLHDRLLTAIMRATQGYFDTNPLGRILNRFGKDMDQIDSLLPITAVDCLQIAFLALGSTTTIAIVVPYVLPLLIPVVIGFIYIQRIYVKSSRELKRLDGISRSPIYSSFAEALSGSPSIRAFELEGRVFASFCDIVDSNHQAYYSFMNSGRWLAVRLDFLVSIVMLFTSLLVVLLRRSIDPGLAGLAITQSMISANVFQWGVRQAAETENLFTSVERVSAMAKEASLEPSESGSAPEEWPTSGTLEWNDVCMRYRKDLPLVLNGLSFSICGGEKIGIVGRTGAGKSSLTAALFRMVQLTSGSIHLDGMDITVVPLTKLRKAIAIVPQDPVLFAGNVRENIDPTGEVDDLEINSALRDVRFTELRELAQGLDTLVAEGGSNFSLGERQLLCLARALVSKAKIVILDEATAAVDNQTDRLMQRAIRESFALCTVITIAHRLNTVAHCDRVFVLSDGRLLNIVA